jgi:hypothetical protein
MQTNPDALKGRGIFKLLKEEGIGSLYRGWGWTMGRNAPGSFAVSLCDGIWFDREAERTGFAELLKSLGLDSCSVVAPLPRSTSSS